MNVESVNGQRQLSAWLGALTAFTGTATWKVFQKPSLQNLAPGMEKLCQTFLSHLLTSASLMQTMKKLLLKGLAGNSSCKSLLKKTALTAILTLVTRPTLTEKHLSSLILQILSVPGLIFHCGPDLSRNLLIKNGLLGQIVKLLAHEQQLKIHFNSLEGSYALCLTANMIDLSSLIDQENDSVNFLDLANVLKRLMDLCGQYVTAKKSNLTHWHPVLGWFSVSMDSYLQNSIPTVRNQLAKLWGPVCLKFFTRPLIDTVNRLPAPPPPPTVQISSPESQFDPTMHYAASASTPKQFLMKAFEKTSSKIKGLSIDNTDSPQLPKQVPATIKLGSPDFHTISIVCSMYSSALKTLTQIKLEILAGLCHGDYLLPHLWTLLQSLGPYCGQKALIDLLATNPKGTCPEFQTLILFSDCMSHLLTILDDIEMYEKQQPFALGHFLTLSTVVNTFLFKAVWSNLILDTASPLFESLHSLLSVLYRRDNRRPFTRPNHWLIKEVKAKELISEMDKGRRAAALLIQKMPQIIPHADRVVLFRRNISQDKSQVGVFQDQSTGRSTLVTIHRSRLVEDGYRQLSILSIRDLKSIIRVKFVNAQGLDEAGIDQDGVFKEFLEETIKKVFDPDLNLFTATNDGRLYPSPTSHLTDNHLALFEFVGKMIGKAVYEGIVVDVPFALFFVSQILGQDHAVAYYSYVDDLPSLDAELYKQLSYVKHYEDGDVTDLGLTFSFDHDVMGQIVTHELVPGGRGINVTNSNRIAYIHQIAQFKMHTQIKKQVAAFVKGFRSIIPPDWLNLFSPPEVIRLISGDNNPLDLKDLRKHTHYYGGFHDNHRVIIWLWDILEKDFDVRERALFLKFVTSCSKPPLLGFQHLEPPFSIRCVEVGDDEDTGDTVGSVLRGFITIGRKDPVNRLPTASTCFNLLKLPNYQKRSTLKEKLRYAVLSNTGFELS